MAVDEPPPAVLDAPEGADRVDTAAVSAEIGDATWGDDRGVPELYVTSPRLARFGAALLGAFVVAGSVRWAWVANALSRQELICEGCSADWFQPAQLALAVAGIAVALVTVAYLTYFVTSGRIWRRWRGIAVSFGVLAASWTALYLVVALIF